MLLYLIRHGDPTYNPDALTPLGRRQAEAIGRRLLQTGMNRIFASSSTRAYQTAEPAAEMLKKEITVLDWANEKYAWAAMSGPDPDRNGARYWFTEQTRCKKVFASDEIRQLGFRWTEHPMFASTDAESGMRKLGAETDAWLAGLGYVHDLEQHLYRAASPNEMRIALFAHAGFSRMFLAHLLDIPYPEMAHFTFTHSGMSVIHFSESGDAVYPVVLMLDGDGHLYKESLGTRFNNGFVV